jgi:hypothetical protein
MGIQRETKWTTRWSRYNTAAAAAAAAAAVAATARGARDPCRNTSEKAHALRRALAPTWNVWIGGSLRNGAGEVLRRPLIRT